MPHHFPLITTLAAAFGFALVLGFVAVRLRQPALVGYLIAGILIGPATPGFVADLALSQQLAEIGVMLLMFGVGLHFSLDDLLAVRRIVNSSNNSGPATFRRYRVMWRMPRYSYKRISHAQKCW